MNITERQWRNLNKKLNETLVMLQILEEKLPIKPKKWLLFNECLPPASVCKDVFSMLNGIDSYTGFVGRLADYYGCETLEFYVDEKIDPKYVAVYYPDKKVAKTRYKSVDETTVLHEFFHHLVNLQVVVVNKKDEEEYADKYAKIVLGRAKNHE